MYSCFMISERSQVRAAVVINQFNHVDNFMSVQFVTVILLRNPTLRLKYITSSIQMRSFIILILNNDFFRVDKKKMFQK